MDDEGHRIELDEKDKKILWLLSIDARQSFSKIAKKLSTSKEVVNYRINRLIESGIIKGFYALIDPSCLGYMNARFFIKFQHTTPQIERKIIDFYVSNELTGWTVSRTGDYDFGAQFWGRSIKELYEVKSAILRKFSRYIKATDIGVYHKQHFFDKKHLVNQNRPSLHKVICASETEELDDTDTQILKILSSDARLSVVENAKKIGVSSHIVNYKLKKLKKNVIKAFLPRIDFEKMGFQWHKISLTLEDYSAIDDIIRFAASHPNVASIYEFLSGGADLEIEVEVKSQKEVKEIIDMLTTRFSKVIRSYDHFMWTTEHKAIFMPKGIK